MSNWVHAMDSLAAGGVIDFDAPAFLLDRNPRYVGNPRLDSLPLEYPIYPEGQVSLNNLPPVDEFKKEEKGLNLVENPSWKKWLFGGFIATAIGYGIYLLTKGKIKPNAATGAASTIASGAPASGTAIPKFDFSKLKAGFTNFINNIKSIFNKTGSTTGGGMTP